MLIPSAFLWSAIIGLSIFVWLNLTLLFFIVFLPVPTAFLGRYGNSSLIVALYAVTQTVITFIYLILTWYASSHHRLIAPALDQKTIRQGYLRSLLTITMFALSIGLAFLNPGLAKLSWLAIFFVRPPILKVLIR